MNSDTIVRAITEQADWLLNRLYPRDRNALIKRGFRILKAVGLQKCADDTIKEDVNLCNINVKRIKQTNICKRKTGRPLPPFFKDWSFERKFSNKQAALRFLIKDGWKVVCKIVNRAGGGHKVYYRCTQTIQPPCAAVKFLFYPSDTCKVFMYINKKGHTNHIVPRSKIAPALIPNDSLGKMEDDYENDTERCLTNKIPSKLSNGKNEIIEDVLESGELAMEISGSGGIKESKLQITSFSNNGNSSANNKPENFSRYTGYKYKHNYIDIQQALAKMKKDSNRWDFTSKRNYKNGMHRYFDCMYKNEIGYCPCLVLLVAGEKCGEILYYESCPHMHDASCMGKNKTRKILSKSPNVDDTVITEKSWSLERIFDDHKTANDYLQKINLFNFRWLTLKNGFKELYICNFMTGTFDHCPASYYLQYENPNSNIKMYSRNIQHVGNCNNRAPHLVAINEQLTNPKEILKSPNKIKKPALKKPRLLGVSKRWILEKEFKTSLEAILYLKGQRIWQYESQTKSKEGLIVFYQCRIQNGKTKCAASKFIHVQNTKNVVCLYKTEQGHTHSMVHVNTPMRAFMTLNEETKTQLKLLVEAGNEPDPILEKLNLVDFNNLYGHLLYDWIVKFQKDLQKNIEKSTPIIKTIEHLLSQITDIPSANNEHEAYCVNFDINDTWKTFRCFLSTRYLLKNAIGSNLIHLDSTYGLFWQKNAVTIIGTTDVTHTAQKFHLFGIAISSKTRRDDYDFMFKAIQKGLNDCHHNQIFKPEYLIADDTGSIHFSFTNLFGTSSKIGTCPKAILPKIISTISISGCASLVKDQLREDITKIFKLPSLILFRKANELFHKKWQLDADINLKSFLKSFKMPFIRISNWYNAFPHFTSDTSKAIWLEYETLKKNSFKPSLSIDKFQEYIKAYIENLSRFYRDHGPKTVRSLVVPITVYEKAMIWKNLDKQYRIVNDIAETRYYIPDGDEKLIYEEKFQKYLKCEQKSFDEFFESYYSFWCVIRSKASNTFTCNCPQYWDDSVCEHSVGMALRLKLLKG